MVKNGDYRVQTEKSHETRVRDGFILKVKGHEFIKVFNLFKNISIPSADFVFFPQNMK